MLRTQRQREIERDRNCLRRRRRSRGLTLVGGNEEVWRELGLFIWWDDFIYLFIYADREKIFGIIKFIKK